MNDNFYTSIAPYYDLIFPANPIHGEFISWFFQSSTGNPDLLDIGCGTGSLGYLCSAGSSSFTGVDPDPEMIRLARLKSPAGRDNLRYHISDMLSVAGEFKPASFDGVLIFGNTFVHLKNEDEMSQALAGFRKLLRSSGKLLLQIINYDKILDSKMLGLPTIENSEVKFQRDYIVDANEQSLLFETTLHIKKSDKIISSRVTLFPLRKERLNLLLLAAGFTSIKYFSSFTRAPFSKGSIPLILVAE